MTSQPTPSNPFSFDSFPDAPPEGERWSTWDGAMHGPTPRPDWVVTALGAVVADLGVLKAGPEGVVHLVGRWVAVGPGGIQVSLPAPPTGSPDRLPRTTS